MYGALRRELREELALDVEEVGTPIWLKEHVFSMSNGWDGQRDTFYLVEVDHFDPHLAFSVSAIEEDTEAQIQTTQDGVEEDLRRCLRQ
jgi:8-oxo-dGTP pyrophosphatase MutT (NUDIX family)